MSFKLPYLTGAQRQRSINMPDFYINFVSSEDVNQLAQGLQAKTGNQISVMRLRSATIALAKKRKEGKHG